MFSFIVFFNFKFQVRKLSHVMQHGRLVNIANFSVYTAASVIKVVACIF